MRNQTSDLQIPQSDFLPISNKTLFYKLLLFAVIFLSPLKNQDTDLKADLPGGPRSPG